MTHAREDVAFGPDQARVDSLLRALAGPARVGVAYSGGVDSATLLALATLALGPDRVVAVLGISPAWCTTNVSPSASMAATSTSPGSR